MDKPLSQERLSEEELQKCISFISIELEPPDQKRLQVIVAEVKRLQAIEAERDRYKEALSVALPIVEHQSPATVEFISQILEGAVNHE